MSLVINMLARPPERLNRAAGSRGGFTLVELGAVVVLAVLVVALLVPAFCTRPRVHSRPLKDSTQVRGILQGMVIWAQNNQDRFPLPSEVDGAGATVAGASEAKDTTSNIMSLVVFNGYVPTEMFLSPAEANGSIEEYLDYEFDEPSTAAVPSAALWDPAFHGSPDSRFNVATTSNPGDIGNNSYAVSPPVGERRELWASTFVATQAVIGNRGPRVENVDLVKGERDITFDRKSNTLLIHGSRDKWEGNVGYADNHVNFETRMDPEGLTYTAASSKEARDVLFYDEPDDPTHTNAYLGIWTSIGPALGSCTDWKD